jgi:PAS domain S-box-containing protein
MDDPIKKALALNLDWFHDVIDGAPDVYNVIDTEGTILYTNSKYFVDGRNIFIGASIYTFFLPEFYDNVREKIKGVFTSGKNDHYELATGFNGVPDQWYMTNLAPIIRNGQVEAVAMYIRNITELKQVQHDLNQMNEELERRVEERTRSLNNYARRLEASEKLNTALRSANNQLQVFDIVIQSALKAFNANFGGVYTLKEEQLQLAVSYENGFRPPQLLLHTENSVIYKFFINQTPQLIPIDEVQSLGCEFCSYLKERNTKSLLLIPLKTKDELVGVLYLSFEYAKEISSDEDQLIKVFVEASGNTLHRTAVMAQLEQTISNRQRELEVLYEIMAVASENEELEVLLRSSIEKVLELLHFKTCAIHLMNGDKLEKKVVVRKTVLVDPGWMDHYFLENDLYEKTIQQKQRYLFTRIPEKNVVCLTLPIRNKGVILGVLTLIGNIDESNLEQIPLISSFADEIGLVLENARQRKQSGELLILEERQRLARDLHDSVSQSLYGLVISADVSNKLLQLKEYNGLKDTLRDMGDIALQSLREMRLMLFELRPLFFDTVGLSGALELRLNTVERRTGIETVVDIVGVELIQTPIDLEIYRIATEALNNSLKHSKAKQIKIELTANQQAIHMSIIDTGIGFKFVNGENGGIGFGSMRERAHRIGGELVIQSIIGQGTTVSLDVPMRKK